MTDKTNLTANERIEKALIENCLNEQVEEQIEYVMERCKSKVSVVAILDDSSVTLKDEANVYTEKFLKRFAEIASGVDVYIYEKGENPKMEEEIGTENCPVMALIAEDGSYSGISFHGVPGGQELESFILAIYNLAGPGQPLNLELKERIKALKGPFDLKMCISLSCTVCPDIVQAGNRLAVLNPEITAKMFDLTYFPEYFDKFDIPSVPAMIINDEEVLFGRKGVKELVEALEKRI